MRQRIAEHVRTELIAALKKPQIAFIDELAGEIGAMSRDAANFADVKTIIHEELKTIARHLETTLPPIAR